MAEANKTVKVDDSVHNKLDRLKTEHDVNTFNEVLRRELGLTPETVDQLTGFLPQEFRDTVERAVEEIDSIGDLEKQITENPVHGPDYNDSPTLQFRAADRNEVIAEVTANEDGFEVYYLNQEGVMSTTGGGLRYSDGSMSYGYGSGSYFDDWDANDVIDEVQKRVTGSYRTWVENR
jgi:predicted CopG family antitoxin